MALQGLKELLETWRESLQGLEGQDTLPEGRAGHWEIGILGKEPISPIFHHFWEYLVQQQSPQHSECSLAASRNPALLHTERGKRKIAGHNINPWGNP